MYAQTITVKFATRKLSAGEIEAITRAVAAQIEEPVDGNGDKMEVHVTDLVVRHRQTPVGKSKRYTDVRVS